MSEIKELKKMAAEFSLARALYALQGRRKLDGVELEFHMEAHAEARRLGVGLAGIGVPSLLSRNNIVDTGVGAEAVGSDVTNIQQGLYKQSKLSRLGANFVSGLAADVVVPPVTAVPIGEQLTQVETATKETPTFGNPTLSPNRISVTSEPSNQLLIQSGHQPNMMAWWFEAFGRATSVQVDTLVFGKIATAVTTNTYSGATWANILAMETDISAADGGYRRLGYALPTAEKAILKDALRADGLATFDIIPHNMLDGTTPAEDGSMNGYYAAVTNAMPTGTILFGDWMRVFVGQFGPLDFTVNPYRKDTSGITAVTMTSFWDGVVLQEDAFAKIA